MLRKRVSFIVMSETDRKRTLCYSLTESARVLFLAEPRLCTTFVTPYAVVTICVADNDTTGLELADRILRGDQLG